MQRMGQKWEALLQRTLEYSFFSYGATTLVIFVSLLMVYQGFHTTVDPVTVQPIEVTSSGPIIVLAQPDEAKDEGTAVLGTSTSASPMMASATSAAQPASIAPSQSQSTRGNPAVPLTSKPVPAPVVPVTPANPIPECNPLDHLVDKVGRTVHTVLPPIQLTAPPCTS